MKVYSSKRAILTLEDEPFSSGGEGEIRKIISAPSDYDNCCVKIYYKNKRTPLQERKIKYMVSNPPSLIKGKGFMIGWPIDYVTSSNNEFLGFVMPLAFSDSIQLVALTTINLSNKLDHSWFERYDRHNGGKAVLARLKLINNIAIPIHILHSTSKYVLKDFKPENVLITSNGRVSIVDMDSVQICENGKLLFPGTVATPNYMPPEYYNNPSFKSPGKILDVSWDEFAIGIVFYQILFGLHPYVVNPYNTGSNDTNEIYKNISLNLFPFGDNTDKIKNFPKPHNNFNIVPKEVQYLFKQAFSSNPHNRPGAASWGKCIHNIIVSSAANDNKKPEHAPAPAPKPEHKPKPQPRPNPKPRPRPRPAENENTNSSSDRVTKIILYSVALIAILTLSIALQFGPHGSFIQKYKTIIAACICVPLANGLIKAIKNE